jgi:hypothetical protein
MTHREHVRGACRELASRLSGMESDQDENEVDLWLSEPGVVSDFATIAHQTTREVPPPPTAIEPKVTLYQESIPSYFPCFSPFAAYIDQRHDELKSETAVSFVESTGTTSTDKSYLRERQKTLEDAGIDRSNQIIILLPDCIPEDVTQKLAVYYLLSEGWMVTEDIWYAPKLRGSRSWRLAGYGTPDIVAWQSDFTVELAEQGWIRNGGTIHELGLLTKRDSFTDSASHRGSSEPQTIVGEVKSSDRSFGEAVKQLYQRKSNPGYLKSGCFDEGYGVLPRERGRDRKGAGTITFDESGFYMDADSMATDWQGNQIDGKTRSDANAKPELIEQLDTFAARMLLCNVTLTEIKGLVNANDSESPHRFFEELDEASNGEILQTCSDVIGQ